MRDTDEELCEWSEGTVMVFPLFTAGDMGFFFIFVNLLVPKTYNKKNPTH